MTDEEYRPAERPPGAPGGDRVRFESENGVEQSMFGGSASDIEASIMATTERNIGMIGWRIMGVGDVVGDLGAGTLQELTLHIENGGRKRDVKITGIGLKVTIS